MVEEEGECVYLKERKHILTCSTIETLLSIYEVEAK